MKGDRVTITISEGVNGQVHMVTKFEPPIPEGASAPEIEDHLNGHRTAEAATVAVGAIGDYFEHLGDS